ncbi:glycosyl hydrolase [Proteiniphilum saccharofermentans]|uniref:glycosyl hydrolase n=1 Tax=Proteiniphilum saccharofermentans TaxID=1642647 RepID=UPI0028AC78AC|nr:glycosyl hydrolase [Proteiniphilum saccharofermentans]
MKKIFLLLTSVLLLVATGCDKEEQKMEEPPRVPKFLYSTPVDKTENVLPGAEVTMVYNVEIQIANNSGITINGQQADVTVSERKLIFDLNIEKNMNYQINVSEGAITNLADVGAPAAGFSFSSAADFKRYEAEDATLSGGAEIASSFAGFSGSGYVDTKEGDISFKVVMPESGRYGINIRYAATNGDKENDLEVNGQKISSIHFSGNEEWATISVNKVSLNTGENSIAIRKNWGWIFVDYIEITEVEEDTPFNIAENLVTGNPSPEAVNLYGFLKENFGQKVISGAMANYSTGIEEAQWMFDNTGKWPAMAGFDLINYTTTWGAGSYSQMTTNVQEWWDNNGIVSIMWHWRDPLKQSDEFYTERTSFDISKINDPDSDEYKAMLEDIDAIALYLKQFKDVNIPILWRPLHEASGGWFWWGAKGAEPCKILWKLMYDRLVNHHQLNNLIWVWTSDAAGDALDWYPGDEYVDIIGMDIYPGENQHGSQYIAFDKVKEMYGGRKILALSECGSIPSIDAMFENGDIWSWFMPWNGEFTRSDNHNGVSFLSNVLNDERVITRDEMPALK